MRRTLALGLCALLFAAGCGQAVSGSPSGGPQNQAVKGSGGQPADPKAVQKKSADDDLVDIYIAVLEERSRSGEEFGMSKESRAIYMVSRTDTKASDPMHGDGAGDGPVLTPAEQQRIKDAFDEFAVEFVAARKDAIVHDGKTKACGYVRGHNWLVILAPPKMKAGHAEVGFHSWAGCEAGHWLTYKVVNTGKGWKVTGTIGPEAIS